MVAPAGRDRRDASCHRPDGLVLAVKRRWVLLALIGAVLVAAGLLASDLAHPTYVVPTEVTRHAGVPATTYDPGLYTPFTQAPR